MTAPVAPKTRRPPHRSFDPRLTHDPETLHRAVVAHKSGEYDHAWALYLHLDREAVARGLGPHWHARMMAALLWYQRTSKITFDLPEDFPDHFGPQYRTVTGMLQDVILNVPKWADPRYNMGVILEGLGQIPEAARHFQRAIEIDDAYAEAWVNLGNCKLHQGDVAGARQCFETAEALNPDDPLAKYNLMHALALFGDWDEAYRRYEYRYLVPGHLRDHGLPRRVPAWDGQSYVHRLVVSDEQGAGDIIQFVRFLPILEAHAGHVFCRVRHPALLPLLRPNYPRVTFFSEKDRVPKADAHVPLLSCISRLNVPESEVPLPAGYLTPPASGTTTVATQPGIVWHHPTSTTSASLWKAPTVEKERQGGGIRTVGVCWAGSTTHKRDGVRSIPWETFRPILDVPGIRYVNLTVGDRAKVEHPALDHPPMSDYAETARIMTGLDLVVTVDTSVLHLAGALGVPCWAMIGASPDMRWMMDRSDTPFYRSVILHRQPRHDDWASVVEQVRTKLIAFT